jgi:hypothetical protein
MIQKHRFVDARVAKDIVVRWEGHSEFQSLEVDGRVIATSVHLQLCEIGPHDASEAGNVGLPGNANPGVTAFERRLPVFARPGC